MPYDDLREGRFSEQGRVYHVVTRVAGGRPLFAGFPAAAQCCKSFHRSNIACSSRLMCWVLMPDHLHLLIELGNDRGLSACIKRLKAHSALETNRALGTRGSVWQRGFYDRALRKEDDIKDAARYIVANPLRAGLVRRVGDYPFWDAVWL